MGPPTLFLAIKRTGLEKRKTVPLALIFFGLARPELSLRTHEWPFNLPGVWNQYSDGTGYAHATKQAAVHPILTAD